MATGLRKMEGPIARFVRFVFQKEIKEFKLTIISTLREKLKT